MSTLKQRATLLVLPSSSGGSGSGVPRAAGTSASVAALPYLNAADFTGFAADGTTDCTSAINAAISALSSWGGGEVRLPQGNVLVSSSPGITLADNVTLVGTGRGTTITQGYWPGLFTGLVSATGTYTNTDVTGATLTSDVASGVKVLALTNTANLTVGTLYLLGSDRAYMNAATSSSNDQLRNRGEIVRVASIDSGTQVTLAGPVRDDYAVADAASLRPITFMTGVGVRNLRIVNPQPNLHQSDFIKFSYCRNFSIQNVTLESGDGAGIHLDMCVDGHINGGHIFDLTDNTGSGRYGYGVLVNRATENVTISGLRIRGGRHAFTTNGVDNRRGVPRNIVISGCVSEGSSADAFDTHVQGANITFTGCSASGGPLNASAFQIRSPSTRIVGCSTDFVGVAVSTNTYAHGCAIISNTFRHSLTYGQAGGGPLVNITGGKHVLVKGNILDGAYVDAVRVTGAPDGLTVEGNLVVNPSARTAGDPAVLIQSTCTGADLRIIGNKFMDFSALTDEAKSSGNMTYPIDCQTTTTGYTITDNVSLGASQTAFVGTNSTGHTLRNNRQLDRINGALEVYVAGSAPADASLASGELAVYLDSTNGAPAVRFKGKTADGTIFTQPMLADGVLVNTQTASYTLVLGDAGKVVEMNVATANTLTVPPNSSVAFPIGTVIEVFQYGAGQTTVTAGAGVTIRSDGGATKTAAQYATAGLRKRGTDEWVLSGDIST